MKIICNEVINGKEERFSSEEHEILSLYYKAVNEKNIALMLGLWVHTDDATMSNPYGGIKRGWDEIKAQFMQVFESGADVYLELFDYSIIHTQEMYCVVGHERGYFKDINSQRVELLIRTSRIFLHTPAGWRLIHHHGSIDNPELLMQYQEAVLNLTH